MSDASAAQKLFSVGNPSATNESLVFADGCSDFLNRCDTEWLHLSTAADGATLTKRDFGKTILFSSSILGTEDSKLLLPDTSESVGAKLDLLVVGAPTAGIGEIHFTTADQKTSPFQCGVYCVADTSGLSTVVSSNGSLSAGGIYIPEIIAGTSLSLLCDGKTWFVNGLLSSGAATVGAAITSSPVPNVA